MNKIKLVTFTVPCYNSAEYMSRCIDSILVGGDDVEIIIVDDGSTKDNTFEVAKEYEKKFPSICRAIHQVNGGHGEAVNTGLKYAKGRYFRVVDSDDWLDKKCVIDYVETIKRLVHEDKRIDLFVTNYVYDKVDKTHKAVMRYQNIPKYRPVTWRGIEPFVIGHYMLMHSLTYSTSLLRNANFHLPAHTFYVDNIYAYYPMQFVETIYYMDINLYHYFIGRSDQSVNEQVMIGRLEQQYRVTNIMLNDVDVMSVSSKNLKDYLISYLSIIMTVTSVLSIMSKDPKWENEKDNLWKGLKEKNRPLYNKLKHTILGQGVNIPGEIGKKLTITGYKIAQKLYGFN